jgi:hypothetical protein
MLKLNSNSDITGLSLDMQYYVDPTKTFTVVVVSGQRFSGVGVAKRNRSDKYDEQVGLDVALGRALQNLGAETEKRAGEDALRQRRFKCTPLSFTAWTTPGELR